SWCQTARASQPAACLRTCKVSRSQFEPGKTTTPHWNAAAAAGVGERTVIELSLAHRDCVLFDDRVRQQLPAHLADLGLPRAGRQVQLDVLAHVDVLDGIEAETVKRVLHHGSLGIQDRRLEADG